MRLFQLAGDGSQSSTWIPDDVERALAGPGLPGPMVSFTRHMSFIATGGAGVAGVAESANGSPFLNAFTSVTVVFASGLKSVIMELSHFNATAGATSLDESSSPPQAARRTPAAHVANKGDSAATNVLVEPCLRFF